MTSSRAERKLPRAANGRVSAAGFPASSPEDWSIVALSTFIHATRDSGYKATSHAVAELVDNAIQAAAKRVAITITRAPSDDRYPMEIRVIDDGVGMSRATLRQSLRFGGSTRFNSRDGLGRFGMGLPNSSLSQARRVSVYSWQDENEILMTYLDVDEIASGAMVDVPHPCQVVRPPDCTGRSGTIVCWSRCDRLDHRRSSTIVRRLTRDLGRQFRHLIANGLTISVNGADVSPVDPLFLDKNAEFHGATTFGSIIDYELLSDPDDDGSPVGRVRVTFSELPVAKWSTLSNDQKRHWGISKGAGVSIVRAGREVDYGWYFLGTKTRENYDDWWRCQIEFEPILDDAFGLTHTKQQIRPKVHLIEALSPDIEATARALNARARRAHITAKNSQRFIESVSIAERQELLLAPLSGAARERDLRVMEHLSIDQSIDKRPNGRSLGTSRMAYRIVEADLRETAFFNYARSADQLVVVVNPYHPFYKVLYARLTEQDEPLARQLRTHVDLLLLAAARAEATEDDPATTAQLERYRQLWSDTLATFLSP